MKSIITCTGCILFLLHGRILAQPAEKQFIYYFNEIHEPVDRERAHVISCYVLKGNDLFVTKYRKQEKDSVFYSGHGYLNYQFTVDRKQDIFVDPDKTIPLDFFLRSRMKNGIYLQLDREGRTIDSVVIKDENDVYHTNDNALFARTDSSEHNSDEAVFPRGTTAWKTYLQENINPHVPVKKGAPPGIYNVVVQFIVLPTGEVSQVLAISGYGFGMEKEVVRVVKTSPKWKPSRENGRLVKAYRKQSITFSVPEKASKKR